MPRPQSKSFDTAWAELIEKALVQGLDGRPAGEGWKSVQEFAASCIPPLCQSHASDVLRNGVTSGKLERVRCRENGHWLFYYRPKM